uniref:ATP synthase F0 subunit 8 n=1 Tax=Panagrolaimus sp. JU765 TaxID=591449 RepID=A0AC34QDZ9_9BILA
MTIFAVIAVIYVVAMLIWLWDSITLRPLERRSSRELTIVESGSRNYNDDWETTSSVTSSRSSSCQLRHRNRLFSVVDEEDNN